MKSPSAHGIFRPLRAFTLVVIAILASLLLPALSQSRAKAREASIMMGGTREPKSEGWRICLIGQTH